MHLSRFKTILLLSPFSPREDNPETHQQQRSEDAHAESLLPFAQECSGEQNAEHRVHESQDRDAAHVVVLQENAPERIRARRDECHVQEQQPGAAAGRAQPSAKGSAGKRHDNPAEEELPAAERDRIFLRRELLDETACNRTRESCDHHAALTREADRAAARLSGRHDDKHPEESQDAADDLRGRELLKPEDKCRQEQRKERPRRVDDRAAHACGVREPGIKEDVLQDRLKEHQHKDILPAGFFRPKERVLLQTSEQDDHHTGDGKARPRKNNPGSEIIRSDRKEFITALDGRRSRAPEKAAKKSNQKNRDRAAPELFRPAPCLCHIPHLIPLYFRRRLPAHQRQTAGIIRHMATTIPGMLRVFNVLPLNPAYGESSRGIRHPPKPPGSTLHHTGRPVRRQVPQQNLLASVPIPMLSPPISRTTTSSTVLRISRSSDKPGSRSR